MKGYTNKYRLINNVRIVLRRHSVVVSPENFNDTLAELILTDPIYSHNYGHNIEVLDEKTLERLKKRREVTQPEALVYEIELPKKKKSKGVTSTSQEALTEESKPKPKRRKRASKSTGAKG
jgi:hypothetical protein